MRIRHFASAAAVALALASPTAIAQNCAGFTDVAASDPFCPNIEWVKNRGITLGCTTTTVYCPGNAVLRSAMAAFLNRLGTALTPVVLPVVKADSATQHDLTQAVVVCQTGNYAVAGFPRRAWFRGRVNLYNPSANGDFVTEMVYIDDGTPAGWKAVQDSASFQTLYAGFAPAHDVSTYPQGFLDLDVGKTYVFGMRISRYTGTAANVASYCANIVEIGNRNGTSSPFDEGAYSPPANQAPPTGRAAPRT